LFITERKSVRNREKLEPNLEAGAEEMGQKREDNDSGAKMLFGRLAAEKKKSVVALCLIAVMAVMWVKVLTKEAPQSAEAGFTAEQVDMGGQSSPELKMTFVELPEVPGRNDIISRDIFDSAGWWDFKTGKTGNNTVGIEEVNVISTDVSEEVVTQIAQQLKLQAIVLGETPWVFINDTLLSMGGRLIVNDGIESYECEVVEIERDSVLIRCREAEITLKLVQTVE